ncbi:MAG: tRNA threonylcarbamoyladenosine dehydratase [Clostridiales bacterium]|nr:tRNA threonylcarbamoyladenosine dehydratase [Clostridiales bacterium]MDO4350095.1 tRNA threonylcarbamoyladenosine dehydratase [Eubacteriales bacterium]MDY4009424.1 tRNA threonylcarbamoyladenosine dehydratase [Candidatus Limiplasma sp.]
MAVSRMERLNRTALLLSPDEMEKLQKAHVLLLGLGGVGSYAAEALARSGIGRLTIVDHDTVAPSNLNRQLPALSSTIGSSKTAVMANRLRDAAPDLLLEAIDAFYLPESPVPIPTGCSVVVDAIDTVSAKLHLAQECQRRGVALVSCMGMGNRLDPTQIRIGDIYETSGCPLCRVMRRELRKRGIGALRCVYSLEKALSPAPPAQEAAEQKSSGRVAPGSVSFVPPVAGLYLAYEAVRLILSEK